MKPKHPTGLGEPETGGKLALFQPPKRVNTPPIGEPNSTETFETKPEPKAKSPTPQRRFRTTLNLTREAVQIIEAIQQEHRLRTGKVLPLWQAVSQAIAFYGQKQGSGNK
jgi:hypothetical protein